MRSFTKLSPALILVAMMVGVWPIRKSSAQQPQQCQLNHPPDPCESLREAFFGTGTLAGFTGCRRLRVDINEKEFRGGCPNCPGGDCLGCFGPAIRDNAIAGWNAAHQAAFGNMFGQQGWMFEVGSKPYDIIARMPDPIWVEQAHPDHQTVTAFTNQRFGITNICCGPILEPPRATMYFQFAFKQQDGSFRPVPWQLGSCPFAARHTAVHEMGHAIGFQHFESISPPFASVMNLTNCDPWPQLGDGQAIACIYSTIYSCCQ